MEAKELRTRSREELLDELLKLRKEQFALRMQRATGQAVKPDQFGLVRRNIARLKTVMREQEIAGLPAGAATSGAPAGGAAADTAPSGRVQPSAATASEGRSAAPQRRAKKTAKKGARKARASSTGRAKAGARKASARKKGRAKTSGAKKS